jgi:hypothetical protein
MKTNLVDLMSENSKLEKEVQELYLDLRRNNMNEDAIELDGNKQNLKDNSDFMEKYKEFNEKLRKINAIKAILFTKNNSLLLSNGSTIQAALVEISNKKKVIDLINILLRLKPSKERITEVNNSYFLSSTLAFNSDHMKKEKERLEEEIKELEFEISQLNSQTFEIDDNFYFII